MFKWLRKKILGDYFKIENGTLKISKEISRIEFEGHYIEIKVSGPQTNSIILTVPSSNSGSDLVSPTSGPNNKTLLLDNETSMLFNSNTTQKPKKKRYYYNNKKKFNNTTKDSQPK
jgi:hypothetical protein